MTHSDYSAHALEAGAIESQPLLSTTTAVECLPISHQIAFRSRLFGLFSLRLLLVVAFILVLEYWQPLEVNFKRKAADQTIVFVLLPLVAVALALMALSEGCISTASKWLWVLVLTLGESVLLAATDAIENTNSGLLAAIFALCTVVSMAIASRVKQSAQLLDWPATACISSTVTAVTMISLFACNQLGSLTYEGFLVLLLVEWMLAGWFAFHATKIYASMEPRQLVEAMASIYVKTLQDLW